jgi:cell division protein FtsA
VRELFEIIARRVQNSIPLEDLSAGVVLTGGTAKLPGIERVASECFGIPVSIASHPDWVSEELKEPQCSTALGLLQHALTHKESNSKRSKKGLLLKVAEMFHG